MMTIPMGSADLARVRFESSPVLTLLTALTSVPTVGPEQLALSRWQRDARRLMPPRAAPLVDLLTASANYSPAFLVPEIPVASRPHRTVDDELQALREVTERDLTFDIEAYQTFAAADPTARILGQLREESSAVVRRLVDAVHAMYVRTLAPDWADIRRRLDREISARGRQTAAAGVGGVLNSLDPRLSWRPDVLEYQAEVPALEVTALDLRGEGLTIVPTPFVEGLSTLIVQGRRSLMVYRMPTPQRLDGDGRPGGLALAMGPTRAAALRIIGERVTTSELAARLGVGLSTASAHASALRAAGLVVTERQGQRVQHRTTELGAELLLANPA